MIWFDVDTALAEVPVNAVPLIDDTDFKSIEASVAFNATGLTLLWNFVTTAGAFTQTAVTPTTAGVYDWAAQGNGMYTIEMPASGGASANNDTEGHGWFSGVADGVLPWAGPVCGFRAAGLNNALIDSAYSATRGLAGTALPDAVANANGGLMLRSTASGSPAAEIAETVVNAGFLSDSGETAATAVAGSLVAETRSGLAVEVTAQAIKDITDLLTNVAKLNASAGSIVLGTVDTVTNTHTPTTTEFQADDITEATADHFIGRIVIFTSGALQYQATAITDYAAVGGIGQFTVSALTEAPANDDTFVIV